MRITSDLQGTVVSVEAQPGSTVGAGRVLAVIESMKMHHDVLAPVACRVDAVLVQQGRAIAAGADLFDITEIGESERAHDEATADGAVSGSQASGMSAAGRADVAEVNERHRLVLDEARSEVVAKRHERGHRTARRSSVISWMTARSWSTARS